MTPDDVLQRVALQEPPGHIRPELTANPSLAGCSPEAGLRVGPQQLAHDALLGWLLVSLSGLDVRQGDIVLAEQTSVHYQDLRVDNVILLTCKGR